MKSSRLSIHKVLTTVFINFPPKVALLVRDDLKRIQGKVDI